MQHCSKTNDDAMRNKYLDLSPILVIRSLLNWMLGVIHPTDVQRVRRSGHIMVKLSDMPGMLQED